MNDETDTAAPDALGTRPWPALPPASPAVRWVVRAREVAAVLASGVVERDRTGRPPHAEVELLKESGLVTMLGPAGHRGGGQDWSTAHRVVRLIAAADGAVGHLLAHHYVWVWLAEFIGTDEKIDHIGEVAVRARWFFSGDAQVRSAPLEIVDAGEDMVFRGEIADPVGCRVSDIVMLEGKLDQHRPAISALAMASEPGFSCAGGGTGLGLRGSTSAPLVVSDVTIPWTGALGHVNKVFEPREYNSFIHPTLHVALANVFLGVARSALKVGTAHAGPRAEPIGELVPMLWQAEAYADLVATQGDALHSVRRTVAEQNRREHAAQANALLDRASAVACEITDRVFDMAGVDGGRVELSRHWRDVRALAARTISDRAGLAEHFHQCVHTAAPGEEPR